MLRNKPCYIPEGGRWKEGREGGKVGGKKKGRKEKEGRKPHTKIKQLTISYTNNQDSDIIDGDEAV